MYFDFDLGPGGGARCRRHLVLPAAPGRARHTLFSVPGGCKARGAKGESPGVLLPPYSRQGPDHGRGYEIPRDRLPSQERQIEVTFEPGAPNPNLLGACGAAVTGLVTINRNGSVLMDQKEFEALDCTERKHYIEKIIFKDGSVKPEIVYGNYDEE
jgi:hypothetical protein